MSEQVKGTIELLQAQIQKQEQEIAEKKRVINSLCPLAGIPLIYTDIEAASNAAVGIRSDEFYGQPLQSVVRSILEKRKRANLGPATVQEIYSAMIEGGYQFSAKNDDYAKRGLYQSLTKNTAVFHKLPNGRYGLLAWYPNAKGTKTKDATSTATVDESTDDEEAKEAHDLFNDGEGEGVQTAEPTDGDAEQASEEPATAGRKPK